MKAQLIRENDDGEGLFYILFPEDGFALSYPDLTRIFCPRSSVSGTKIIQQFTLPANMLFQVIVHNYNGHQTCLCAIDRAKIKAIISASGQ